VTLYTKPHLSFSEQVDLLTQRGLSIGDRAGAAHLLGVIGYYRLSGYWYPYRRPLHGRAGRDDRFVDGATFERVVRLYDMDRRLKLMVLDAIERVEVALRVKIGYTLGRRGAYAHLHPQNLDGQFTRSHGSQQRSTYDGWLQKILTAQARSSEDFVVHFQDKYGGRLPVWVLTEIMDFGSMTYLYQGLKSADRNEIARTLDILDARGTGNGGALSNWMRVLNYVRNVCAHHSRLWNRNLVNQIAPRHLATIPSLAYLSQQRGDAHFRIYSTLCILAFLLSRIEPGSEWSVPVQRMLTEELPGCGRGLQELGFPADWAGHAPWVK